MPNAAPKIDPPITSLVQCSPRLTLEKSIAIVKTERSERAIILYSCLILFDLIIRLIMTTTRKIARIACPDGYEKPGWTYDVGNTISRL